MKKIILTAVLALTTCAAFAAEPAATMVSPAPGEGAAPAPKKKTFMQVGAVEKVENDKYVMRKTETRYEFYIDENAGIYLRSEASFDSLQEKCYVVIKGPKNKKTVLANAVYIYRNKAEYEGLNDKKEDLAEGQSKVFSTLLEGTLKQKDPFIITLADGREYAVSYDEDAYWIKTEKSDKSEIKAGERIKLYFDKLYSIRYKNYPYRIIIDRVKAGF
jgi:hypothetical protein